MTVVENKLLGGERTHAVPKQDVWLAWMFVLCDDPQRNHVFDELVKTTGPEFTKTSGRLCGEAMTAVIISINDKFRLRQCLG